MAFDLTWKIQIADCAGTLDVTSYVFDGLVDMNAPIGQQGRSTAKITINNQSGAFTPFGGGTYANVNWFAKALVIRASSVSTGQDNIVYSGLITDFTVNNESKFQSSVSIVALDFLTIAGRTSSDENYFTSLLSDASDIINVMIPGGPQPPFYIYTYFSAIQTPFVGGTSSSAISVSSASDITALLNSSKLSQGTLSDWINNEIMPSLPGTIFMDGYTNTATKWTWEGRVIDRTLNRTDAGQRTFAFVDKNPTSGEIPYSAIDVNFALDALTNNAICGDGTYSVTKADSDSGDLYGVRSRSYNSLINATNGSIDAVASFWSNRYSVPRYIPASIGTSYAILKGNAVDDGVALTAFIELLAARTALWNRIGVKYQLAGMNNPEIAQVVANSRRITFNPSNTTITLGVVAGVDNQSFILDSTTYGILGGSGITYNQPEISYNEFEWTYNDSYAEQGNRLG